MPAGGWHLDDASLRFTSSGGNWGLSAGGQFIEHTDAATLLPSGDDTLGGPLNLTFPFAYPGGAGSTTAIDVNSNGRVYLEAGTNPYTGGWYAGQVLPNFLAATPSTCILGADMNTGAGGLLYFEERTFGPDTGALVFALMHCCGITIRRSRLDATYDFLQRGTGTNGYLWSLDEAANNNSWADVGRTGASALANFLTPCSGGSYQFDAMAHTTLMGTHAESFPDTHGSPTMGMGYAAAALAFDPPTYST